MLMIAAFNILLVTQMYFQLESLFWVSASYLQMFHHYLKFNMAKIGFIICPSQLLYFYQDATIFDDS